MMRDYAVAPYPNPDAEPAKRGVLILHKPDCRIVRAQADLGDPVLTLYGCEGDPDPKMARCSCLETRQ